MLADWVTDPPVRPLPLRHAFLWSVYPVAYVCYTLIRGAVTGWYPYPFLNPANGGYSVVAGYVGAIVVLGVGLCVVLIWLGNLLRARR